MKKNIILFLLLSMSMLFISGCINFNIEKEKNITSDNGEIKSIAVDWDLNNEDMSVKEFFVDEALALEIGNAVIKSVYNEDVISQTEFQIYDLGLNDVFVVSRFPKEEMLGGDYNVAISKKNGAILKIWVGE